MGFELERTDMRGEWIEALPHCDSDAAGTLTVEQERAQNLAAILEKATILESLRNLNGALAG